jgi:cytochrome c oxidase subunit 1
MRSFRRRLGFAPLWLFGAGYVVGVQALEFRRVPALPPGATYYVIYHPKLVIGVSTALLMMAAVYWAVEAVARLPLRRWLGWVHFGATFAGLNLIFMPKLALGLFGQPERDADLVATFRLLSLVSTIGYALVVGGMVVFVLLLIDAGVRFRPSHPGAVAP